MSVNTRDHSEFRAGRWGLIASCHDRLDLRTAEAQIQVLWNVGTMHPASICHSGVWSVDGLRSHGASGGAMVRAAH